MSYRNPSIAAADPSHVWDHDARVLAGLLRSAPLTVLLSPPGVDTTPMLLHGVMPKLRRRVTDRAPREDAAVAASGTVIEFADRRDARAGLLARRDREIAVFFDAWNADPVASLLRQVQQAVDAPWMPPLADDATLIDVLIDLQARHNLRFLLLLDRFEDALAQRATSARIGEFIEQWIEAVAHPDLAAHFLVALPEADLRRFDGVRERLSNFDDRCLRANGTGRLFGLASVSTTTPSDLADRVVPAPGPVSVPVPAPAPSPAVASEELAFMASLALISERVAAAAKQEAEQPVVAAPSPSTTPMVDPPAVAEPAAIRSDGFDAPAEPQPRPASVSASPPATRAPAAAWLILPLIALVVWWWYQRDVPQPLATLPAPPTAAARVPAESPTAALPAPTTPPADSVIGPAALDIAVDPANATDARIARELTASLAPVSGIELPALPSRGGLATLVDLDAASTSPRLAIANYDALQAARTLALRPRLSVVTPLYMQEIYFIVRADSPLRFLHDLRGARIDAGPADGSRSLTAAAVYGRLFNEPLPATSSTARNEDDALAELLAFHTVDVVATVGGQPLPWLANLPKATRQRIRLLRLDGHDAIDRRALQSFLPSTVHGLDLGDSPSTNTPTLAVMSFLVTNAQPDDAQASARLTDFARGLCRALPSLRQAGHPKWSEVTLGLTLPTGFADSTAAQAGFGACTGGGTKLSSTPPARPVTSHRQTERRPA